MSIQKDQKIHLTQGLLVGAGWQPEAEEPEETRPKSASGTKTQMMLRLRQQRAVTRAKIKLPSIDEEPVRKDTPVIVTQYQGKEPGAIIKSISVNRNDGRDKRGGESATGGPRERDPPSSGQDEDEKDDPFPSGHIV